MDQKFRDPIAVVNAFNECINSRDLEGLSQLMDKDHRFIDRDGMAYGPATRMIEGWRQFFEMFPDSRNTFEKIVAHGDRVFIRGFAFWNNQNPYDRVIWTARVLHGRILEWTVYKDIPENRIKFDLV